MILVSTTAAPHHATYPAHMRQDDNRQGDHGQPSDPTFGAVRRDLPLPGVATLQSPDGPSFQLPSFPLRRDVGWKTDNPHGTTGTPAPSPLDLGEFISGSGNPSKELPLRKHKLETALVASGATTSTAEALAGGLRSVHLPASPTKNTLAPSPFPAGSRPLFTIWRNDEPLDQRPARATTRMS